MKTLLLIFSFFISVIYADQFDSYYFRSVTGVNKIHHVGDSIKFHNGYSIGIILGRDLLNYCHLELEARYFTNNFSNYQAPEIYWRQKGSVSHIFVGSNFIADIPYNRFFTPYLGVGTGVCTMFSQTRAKDDLTLWSKPHFQRSHYFGKNKSYAAQVIIGSRLHMFETIDYTVEYKYLTFSEWNSHKSIHLGFIHVF